MSGYDDFFKEVKKTKSSSDMASGKPKHGANAGRRPLSKSTSNPRLSARNQKENSESLSGKTWGDLTPEDHLRTLLLERQKARNTELNRKQKRFPIAPVVFLSVVLVLAIVIHLTHAFENDEWVTDFISMGQNLGSLSELVPKLDVSLFGEASASNSDAKKGEKTLEGSANSTSAESSSKENPAASTREATDEKMPDIRRWSEEELSIFKKLNERKNELDLREAELNRLEEELQSQRSELEHKLKQLEKMRNQISKTLEERVKSDQEKIDKLIQVYSSMKPQQAAKVIETLVEDLAVEVLDKMKKKSAAEILNMMDAKKARRLSELLTGYQRQGQDDQKGDRSPSESKSADGQSGSPSN